MTANSADAPAPRLEPIEAIDDDALRTRLDDALLDAAPDMTRYASSGCVAHLLLFADDDYFGFLADSDAPGLRRLRIDNVLASRFRNDTRRALYRHLVPGAVLEARSQGFQITPPGGAVLEWSEDMRVARVRVGAARPGGGDAAREPRAAGSAGIDLPGTDVDGFAFLRTLARNRAGDAPGEREESPTFERFVSPALLSALRLGVKESGILMLPEHCDLAEVRREFHRVAVLRRVAGKEPTASNLVDPAREDEPAMLLTLVSRRDDLPDDAQLAAEWGRLRRDASDPGPNRFFGPLLGYPACCVERFCALSDPPELAAAEALRREPRPPEANVDLFAETRGKEVGPYPALLNHLVGDRFQLFFHFPCSYRCATTLEKARRFAAAIGDVDPAFAARLRALFAGLTLVFTNDEYLHFDVADPTANANAFEATLAGVKAAQLREPARREAWRRVSRPGTRVHVSGGDELRFVLPDGDTLDARRDCGEVPLSFWFTERA